MRKVVVVISLYKNDKLLNVEEAINSLWKQTYEQFELYVQLDGAVSSSVYQYLRGINDERFYFFQRDENKGLAYSLNELLRRTIENDCYEYIFRMDADDISLPTRFEKQIAFMDAHPEIDCLGTWAIEIDSNGEEYFRKQMPVTHEECFELFKKRDCMIHPTVMFRRTYFEKAGLYPEDTYFGEDTMMWARGFANGCIFANIPEYLFKYRLDENFFKRRRGWKHAKSIFTLRRRVNSLLKYPISADIYAFLYAFAKMMPTSVLNLLYKTVR